MVIENSNSIIPQYINQNFFKNVLENESSNKYQILITNVLLKMGLAPGENNLSDIYRAIVSYKVNGGKEQKLSLIVKSMPTAGGRAILEDLQVYKKESKMYFEVLPKIEKLLGGVKIGPKCYYATANPIKTIVFEDLKELGFQNRDRKIGFDEPHTKMILKKLAQFHAASMVLCKTEPNLVEGYDCGLFSPGSVESDMFQHTYYRNLECLVPIVREWPGYKRIAEKLQRLLPNLRSKLLENVERNEDDLKVLNHGDLWVTNIMFTYNRLTQKPKDSIFLDFQLSFFTSLGIDMAWFLNTSVQLDVLQSKRDKLMSIYYDTLSETLKSINYSNIPTKDRVLQEIRNKEFFGFVVAIGMFAVVITDRTNSDAHGIECLADKDISDKNRAVTFASKRFVDTMKYSLKRFDEIGIFD